MSDFIEALNLITSEKIHELYARQDTEDPLVLRKKVGRRADRSIRVARGEVLSKCSCLMVGPCLCRGWVVGGCTGETLLSYVNPIILGCEHSILVCAGMWGVDAHTCMHTSSSTQSGG